MEAIHAVLAALARGTDLGLDLGTESPKRAYDGP
jgi:hypothetical protein